MANVIIASPVLSDAATSSATVSSTSELAANPASELKNPQLTRKWQASTGVSTVTITYNLGSTVSWDFVGVFGANFGSTTTMRVRAASTVASLTTPSLSTTITFRPPGTTRDWDRYNSFILFSAAQTYQHVDITFSGTSAEVASVGMAAGRIYISDVFQPAKTLNYGAALAWADESRSSKTLGGQTYVDARPTFRRADFTLSFMTKAEAIGNALAIDRLRGSSQDIVVVLDPAETTYLHDYIIYGRMRETTPVDLSAFNIFEKTYRVEEMI